MVHKALACKLVIRFYSITEITIYIYIVGYILLFVFYVFPAAALRFWTEMVFCLFSYLEKQQIKAL